MKKNNKGLSIIIPILNENDNLINLTKKIYKFTKGIKFEVIFIDDNSEDNSYKTLKLLKKRYRNLKYFIRKKKNDLTQSCFLGIKKSNFKNILIMDGDGQHDPKYIYKMFKIFSEKNMDFVIGVRNFYKKDNSLSTFRFFASKILIFLLNFLFNIKTADPMSGFFIFKKNFYIQNKKIFFGKGYKILADFIYSTNKSIKIYDFKIKFLKRKKEKSKMSFKILIILIFFIIKKFF